MVVGSVGISPLDTPAVYSLLSGGDGCFAVNATNGSIVRKCLEIKREAAVNLTVSLVRGKFPLVVDNRQVQISAASDPPTVGQTVALCEVHIAIETIGSISPSIVYPNDMDSVVTVDEGLSRRLVWKS